MTEAKPMTCPSIGGQTSRFPIIFGGGIWGQVMDLRSPRVIADQANGAAAEIWGQVIQAQVIQAL